MNLEIVECWGMKQCCNVFTELNIRIEISCVININISEIKGLKNKSKIIS